LIEERLNANSFVRDTHHLLHGAFATFQFISSTEAAGAGRSTRCFALDNVRIYKHARTHFYAETGKKIKVEKSTITKLSKKDSALSKKLKTAEVTIGTELCAADCPTKNRLSGTARQRAAKERWPSPQPGGDRS
jgi:hypothetical protein